MGEQCVRGHKFPPLQQICSNFHKEPSEVLNMYVVGSHMWGTCSSHSDWDLIIIVKDLKSSIPQNTHKGCFDAFILSREQYNDQLAGHSMQVLLTLWLPEQYILKQTFNPRAAFVLHKDKLINSLAASRDRDVRIAEKHFRKGDTAQAKKVLVHCIRYLDMGNQIKNVHKNDSLDYSSAAQLREQVLSNYSKSWEEFVAPVQELLSDLWSNLMK